MYTELHAHSHFSFLDGAAAPEALAARAAELGMDALAVTGDEGYRCRQRPKFLRAGQSGWRIIVAVVL